MYDSFKIQPIVYGRAINLNKLRDSQCPVSSFLKAQKLSLLFSLCGLEFFEKVVRLFHASLRISTNSGEAETLVMGYRIIINELLFEDVFGTKFSAWPDDFEVSLEGAKRVVAKPDSDLFDFGTLSLCFEHCLLAHIVATTLISRKGSLSSISTHVEDPNASASLSYGLLILRILVDHFVDLSMFTPIVINSTYDSRTFSSMGTMMNSRLAPGGGTWFGDSS
ncbi:hypothetical protein H5410_022303 [Solanum commersonii]|uniref:Uncharacterized protein n=1 Tax=Solanum commersonii TaxID=4109 RepID=A0A9J5ZJ37_SOLCO|nr:hypothetical protein H5410_022303 [Solanum commersonii]